MGSNPWHARLTASCNRGYRPPTFQPDRSESGPTELTDALESRAHNHDVAQSRVVGLIETIGEVGPAASSTSIRTPVFPAGLKVVGAGPFMAHRTGSRACLCP